LAKNPWEFDDDAPEPAQSGFWDSVQHGLSYVGDQALHALPDLLGVVGDTGLGILKAAQDPMHGTTIKDIPLPGTGPVTKKTNESFDRAVDNYTHNNTPKARNKFEQYAGNAARGIADVMTMGGPEGGARAALSGASAALAGQAVYDATGNEELATLATLAGGLAPEVSHGIVRSANTARIIRSGASKSNYGDLVGVIQNLEGGGTLAHPKTSKKGAMGVMQVMPDTARAPGFGIRPWDGKSQADLARVGKQYAAALNHKYGGDTAKVLAAYNAGPGRVDTAIAKHGDNWLSHLPKETKKYVANGTGGRVNEEPVEVADNVVPMPLRTKLDDVKPYSYDNQPPVEWWEELTPAERQEVDASIDPAPIVDNTGYEKFTPFPEKKTAANDLHKPFDQITDEEWARLPNEVKQNILNVHNNRQLREVRPALPSPEAVQRAKEMGAKSLEDFTPEQWTKIEEEVHSQVSEPEKRRTALQTFVDMLKDDNGTFGKKGDNDNFHNLADARQKKDLKEFHAKLMGSVKERATANRALVQKIREEGLLPYEVGDRFSTSKSRELNQGPWKVILRILETERYILRTW
jgi:hypothetical protein